MALHHAHLDAFHNPAHVHPSDSCSATPRTAPLSFRNLSNHERATSSCPSPSFDHPFLTIRKSSCNGGSTANNSYGCAQIAHQAASPPRTRCRRPSTDLPPSPDMPPRTTSPYSSTHSSTDALFAVDTADGDDFCPRHHHRQSTSSTVSISCSDRGNGSEVDDYEPRHQLDHLEGEVEAQIAMEPMPPTMLIPLVDRAEEMRELLMHPNNSTWTRLARNTLGPEVYDGLCVPLWSRTGRGELSDYEWLKKSERLLARRGDRACCDGRLWSGFCGMVGWDAGAVDFGEGEAEEEAELARAVGRRGSRGSILSTSSGKMSSIAEELEDDDNNYRTSHGPEDSRLE